MGMIFGHLPNLDRMDRCLADRFVPIVDALKTGNLLLFKKALCFYQDDFINSGIFLLVQALELLVFRALILKIYVTKQRMVGLEQPSAVKLSEIRKGIKIQNEIYDKSKYCELFEGKQNNDDDEEDVDRMMVEEMDEDEIECLVSTLIFKKL